MCAIYFLLLMSLLFSRCEFHSKYLASITVCKTYNLKIDGNTSTDTSKFVQIFSPFYLVNVISPNESFTNVLQAGFFISNTEAATIQIISQDLKCIMIWYRVINATGITFDDFPKSQNINLNISQYNSYLSITFDATYFSYNYSYQLWTIPIYPSGQVTSWSSEFSSNNTKNLIIPAVNSSIDSNYLTKHGRKIAEYYNKWHTVTFNLVNRNPSSYLIIIQLRYENEFKMQLTPAIIYGCLSKSVFSSTYKGNDLNFLNEDNTCQLIENRGWFVIICVALVFIILFVLTGYLNEIIQIFVSSWTVTAYISCIGYHYLFGSIYDSGSYLYGILLGAGFGFGLLLSLCSLCMFKKGNRLRMFFNIICIILIVLSIIWFCFENIFRKYEIIASVIATVSFVCFIFLMICNGFTSTFGSTLIGMSLMCVGFSLVTVQSSAIPFLFMDFFNYILFRNVDINYYSLFLQNDVIILSFWIFLTLFIGISSHRSWCKKHIKTKSTVHPNSSNYGTIRNNIVTNQVSNSQTSPTCVAILQYTHQTQNTPQFINQPTAPIMDDEPPPYSRF